MSRIRNRYSAGYALIFIFMIPVMAGAAEWQAADWTLSLKGALRISYNEEDCDSECRDVWRNADPVTSSEDQSDDYLTNDISRFAVSGSRMMDSGMNAVFKSEWRVDTPEDQNENMFHGYEQYIGLDAKWGLLRAGTIDTPYMQFGVALDPFTDDALSARYFVDLQSALHHSTGKGRGRSTNTLRYDSPISKTGIGLQLFTGFDNSKDGDSSYGGGITYTSQRVNLFAQYYNNGESGKDEAYKIGGKFGGGSFALLWQYEFDEGLISLAEDLSALGSEDISTADGENRFEDNETTGADVWYAGLTYQTGRVTLLYEYGERKDSDNGQAKEDGHSGWIFGVKLLLDQYLYIYTGYLEKHFNDDRDKDSRYTIGATLTF